MSIRHHRAIQHEHALDRLRERFLPDAEMADVQAIRDLAADASRAVKALPGSDVKHVFVAYRGHFMRALYCPRHHAVRTVLLP